jgi:hypothetical protein
MRARLVVNDADTSCAGRIRVKSFCSQSNGDDDPGVEVGVADSSSVGHLYASVWHGSGSLIAALDDVLVKAEKLQALPEYRKAYDHWKTRAKAYRRGVIDASRAACPLHEHLHDSDKPGHRLRLSSIVTSHHH